VQPLAWLVLCIVAILNTNKIVDSIYYLHEKLNGISKNIVSSSRSDELQHHINTDIIYLTDATYLWGIKNKIYFYSESTLDLSAPIIKSSAPASYDLTLAGYTFKDLYPFYGGWIAIFRKNAGTQPLFRLKLYNETFVVTDTIDITAELETLYGGIFAYDDPYIWIVKGNGLIKVDTRDSSIALESLHEFQYWNAKEYTWFNRHVSYDGIIYYFDDFTYLDGNIYTMPNYYSLIGSTPLKPTCPISFDGTYFYIHDYRMNFAIAKKVV
jgi:hypothetical protein